MEQLEDEFVAGEWIPPFLQPSLTLTPPTPTRKKQQITAQKRKKSENNIPLTCKYRNKTLLCRQHHRCNSC